MACPKCGYARASSHQDCPQCAKLSYDVDGDIPAEEMGTLLEELAPSSSHTMRFGIFDNVSELGWPLVIFLVAVIVANLYLMLSLYLVSQGIHVFGADGVGTTLTFNSLLLLIFGCLPAIFRIAGAVMIFFCLRRGFYLLLVTTIYAFLLSGRSALADIINFASITMITIPVILRWEHLE